MTRSRDRPRSEPAPHWIERVNRVMDAVRNDPSHEHALDDLARVAHASPYHFHRIFRTITGETVGAFVRRARLERAAYLMKSAPSRKLTSIALETGFPSLSELSRAFRKTYGISPSAWDRKSTLRAPSPLEAILEAGNGGGDDPPTEARTRPSFTPRIVERPACRVAYRRIHTVFHVDDLRRGFDELTRVLARCGIDWQRRELIGMSWDNYETTPLDRVHYDLCFDVPEDTVIQGEVGVRDLPAFRAVEVHCVGGLQVIADAWDHLYDEWFPASDYQPAHMPGMKRFRKRPDELEWKSWDLYCSLAIEPALP